MRGLALGAGFFVLTLSVAAAAARQAESESDEAGDAAEAKPAKTKHSAANRAEKERAEHDRNYSHALQVGIRTGLVGGFRMIDRYEPSPYCTKPHDSVDGAAGQRRFCGFAAPMALDLAASFTLVGSIEPFLWARFGFIGEGKTDTQPLMLVGLGARLYTMSDSAFKIFIEPAVAVELEKGRGTPAFQLYQNGNYRPDLLFHLAFGPQLDLARYVGLYLHGGLTVGVLRYISGTLELVGGVQARFP